MMRPVDSSRFVLPTGGHTPEPARLRGKLKSGGFTLVELVVFIVIIGIAAVGLLLSMRSIVPRTVTGATLTKAAEIAQMRMELILAQRDVDGFSSTAFDPCSGGTPVAALCTNPLGFTVTVSGVATAVQWTAPNNNNSIKVITVTVSDGTRTLASMTSLLANY